MPENVNTSALVVEGKPDEKEDDRPVMIKVDHVSMSFNMASEQLNSLKEYAVAIAKRKLFFEEFKALDDVSFEVRKGDVFGIMGTNGSGKSTMLKIIAGVLEPTKGTCQVNGNIAPLIELGAGFDMDLSARENIYLNGALLGYSKEFIDENFDAIVEFAEVEKFLDMPLKNYSSGMVARIAFAIATVIVPEILVVDEVLSVGDFMFQKKCEDRITELIEQHGVTVLIVSHNNDQIARLCNKAIWIEKGHERLQGDAGIVCRVYGGLGGRTGSSSSEEKVLGAIRSSLQVEKGSFETFSAHSPSAMSARIVSRYWLDKPVDTVVLAVDNTHINALVGNSVAGALKCPLLSVSGDGLSDAITSFLYEKRPGTIFVFDIGSCASWSGKPQLGFTAWSPSIRIFQADGCTSFEFSEQIFRWGIEAGVWNGRSVALTSFEAVPESIVSLPLLYLRAIPVLVDERNTAFVKQALSEMYNQSVSRVFCPDLELEAFLREDLEKHSVKLCHIDEALVLDESIQANDSTGRIFIASYAPSQWPYLLSSGCCIAQRPGCLFLFDQRNLDSIATGLDFIDSYKGSIDEVVYLDGSDSLSDVDKGMFACRLGR